MIIAFIPPLIAAAWMVGMTTGALFFPEILAAFFGV